MYNNRVAFMIPNKDTGLCSDSLMVENLELGPILHMTRHFVGGCGLVAGCDFVGGWEVPISCIPKFDLDKEIELMSEGPNKDIQLKIRNLEKQLRKPDSMLNIEFNKAILLQIDCIISQLQKGES